MPYRILRDEPASSALIRIACEQMDTALRELGADDLTDLEKARQARRRSKRVRALLGLYRGGLGERARTEDRFFRAALRALGPYRDADVRIDTLAALLAAEPGLAQAPEVTDLRPRLLGEREALCAGGRLREALAGAQQAFAQARERAPSWQVGGSGFAALHEGLVAEYAAGRRALRRARAAPDDTDLRHAWRRAAKNHWLHATLLRDVWPAAMDPHILQVRELVDLLGDEHNLIVLEGWLWPAESASPAAGAGAPAALQATISRERTALLERAWPLGRYLYAERPPALARRWRAWWRLWRAV